jgi:hypothetical protein
MDITHEPIDEEDNFEKKFLSAIWKDVLDDGNVSYDVVSGFEGLVAPTR